jgi:hypothetical protein
MRALQGGTGRLSESLELAPDRRRPVQDALERARKIKTVHEAKLTKIINRL